MVKYCGNCGKILEEGSSFCENCGQKVGDSIIANTPLKQSSEIPLPFIPIEKTDYKIVYQTCVSKSVVYFNTIAICLISGLDFLLSFVNNRPPDYIAMTLLALAYFWIGPSGTRRVYNKSHGARIASNVACLLSTWFGLFGWGICCLYEIW